VDASSDLRAALGPVGIWASLDAVIPLSPAGLQADVATARAVAPDRA